MLSLDGWTLFFTVVNVLVLFVGLKVFLFKPVLNIIRQREEMIHNQLADAAEKEKAAEQLKTDYQEKLKNASQKAEDIIAEAKARADEEKRLAVEKTKEETEQMLEKARAEIRSGVQADIAVLAMEAARKIMKTGDVHDAAGN